MKIPGAVSDKPRLPKRVLDRILKMYKEQTLFRISKKEAVKLAVRDYYMRRNRSRIIKAAIRIQIVRNCSTQHQQLTWHGVFDHMMPSHSPTIGPAPHVKEFDFLLQDKPETRVRPTTEKLTASNQLTDEQFARLHFMVLDEALGSLAKSKNKKVRNDVLRWVFRPKLVAHPNPARPPVQTRRVPFNFQLCCSVVGVDGGEIQDQLLPLLSAEEKAFYEQFIKHGDRPVRCTNVRPRDRQHRGWLSPAHA